MKSNYSQKLLDPRWQKKRLEILERDNWVCYNCGEDRKTLHVHHRVYMSGEEPWDIDNDLLVTLCADCHEDETNNMAESMQLLANAVKSRFLSGDIKEIAEGFAALSPNIHSEVFATAIKHCLSDPIRARELYDRYFEHINKDTPPLEF